MQLDIFSKSRGTLSHSSVTLAYISPKVLIVLIFLNCIWETFVSYVLLIFRLTHVLSANMEVLNLWTILQPDTERPWRCFYFWGAAMSFIFISSHWQRLTELPAWQTLSVVYIIMLFNKQTWSRSVLIKQFCFMAGYLFLMSHHTSNRLSVISPKHCC